MGLFRRTEPPAVVERAMSFQQLGLMTEPRGGGVVTDSDDALKNAAVWACVDVLAGSVSSLPVDAVRSQGNIRVPVSPTPSLLTAPSAVSTLDVWLYQLMWSLLTDGNGFGIITATDSQMRPTSIELVDPASVRERKFSGGRATVVIDDGPTQALYPMGPVWHVPGKMTKPGSPFALSPLAYAGRSIGTALSAEKFAGDFFADGGHPTHKVTSDQPLTAAQADDFKQRLLSAIRGNREPVVLGSGLDIQPMQSDMDTTEYLDLLRFEVEQVCRYFRVPPSMVYGAVSGQSVTYANVSQADLHYLKHSLDGYLVRIERALTDALPRPQVVKFNRDALLRSDTLTRYQAHQIGLTAGFLEVDEVRELEDRPPLPGAPTPPPEVSNVPPV